MMLSWLVLASTIAVGTGFSSPIFQEVATQQRFAPSKTEGVEIELPDFDELFGRLKQVSPLARLAIEDGGAASDGSTRGFEAIGKQDNHCLGMKWKTVESNKRKTVHHIDRIDNFQNLGSPILRFRSSLKGPCVGEAFANFIMDVDERKKWDAQIEQVYEYLPIHDLDAANIAMSFGKYGDCSRLGVGYCQTKANLGISGREQLTLCGIQDFQDGSTVIWGTEMEDKHNHLFPPGERYTRARSHLFSTTLVPTGEDSFDVEYVLQLDIGGNMPTWLTAPIVVDTVKSLFRHAEDFFKGEEGSELHQWIEAKAQQDSFGQSHSILMTP